MRFSIGSYIAFALNAVLCAQTRDDLLSRKVDEAVTQFRQELMRSLRFAFQPHLERIR